MELIRQVLDNNHYIIRIVQSNVRDPPVEFNFMLSMMTKVPLMTTILTQIYSMMLLLDQPMMIPHHQMTQFWHI